MNSNYQLLKCLYLLDSKMADFEKNILQVKLTVVLRQFRNVRQLFDALCDQLKKVTEVTNIIS